MCFGNRRKETKRANKQIKNINETQRFANVAPVFTLFIPFCVCL